MAEENQAHDAYDLEQRMARLTAFREVAQAIGASLDLGEICRRALEATLHVVGGEAAALYSVDRSMGKLRSVAFSGVSPRNQAKYSQLPLDESTLTGRAVLTGKPQIGSTGELPPLSREISSALGTRNYASIPVFSRHIVLGVLNVTVDPRRPVTDEDVEILREIAAPIGIAMDNSALYSQTVGLNACLLAADNLLQTLVDNAMEYINYLDRGFGVLFASRKTLAFFDVSAEDALNRSAFDGLSWLGQHEMGRSLVDAVRTGERQTAMETFLALPGRPDSYWDFDAIPVKDGAGKVQGVLAFALDVTDKVQARQAAEEQARREKAVWEVALAVNSEASLDDVLRTAVQRLADVLQAPGSVICLLDPSGQRMHGVSGVGIGLMLLGEIDFDLKDLPVAQRALRIRHPIFASLDETSAKIRPILERSGIAQVLCVPLLSDGRSIGLVYVQYTSPRPQPSPEEVEFAMSLGNQCAVAIDKARLLDEARTQRGRLESIIEWMPEGVAIVRASDRKTTLTNRAVATIFGRELPGGTGLEEIPAMLGLSRLDGSPIRAEELVLGQALSQGRPVRGLEVLVTRPDGSKRYLVAAGQPLFDEAGRVREAIVVLQDVTPLKKAQRRVEEQALRERAAWEVSLAVNSEAGLSDVLRTALERMSDVLKAEGGVICLLDPSEQRLRVVSAVGLGRRGLEVLDLALEDMPVSQRALTLRRPVFMSVDETSPVVRPFLESAYIRQILCVPLVSGDRSIGMAYIYHANLRDQPSPEEMEFAMSLGNQCATAIEKARLLDDVQTQRNRLETIIDWMPEGVVIVRASDGRVTRTNRGATRILGQELPVGIRLDEVAAMVDLRHPDGRPIRPEEMVLGGALLHRRPVSGVEQMISRPDGSKRYLLAAGQPLFDEEGELREALVVLQDVTPLKEAQTRAEELAEVAADRADELDAVIENMAEGVTIMDPTGKILYLNRTGREIWGVSGMVARGFGNVRDYLEAVDLRFPDGRPLAMEQRPNSRALRGETYSDLEVVNYRPDGRRTTLLFSSSHLREKDGRLMLCIVVYRDITRLRELEHLREDYMRIVAHDLRAPLTIIQGQAQMAARLVGSGKLDAGLKSIGAVVTSAQRMNGMIQDLVDAVRLESGQLGLQIHPVDLVEFVGDLIERMVGMTENRVLLQAAYDLPSVLADENRLERIVTNLLTNALKYSPPGSPVTVRIWPREGEVVTSLIDRGIGIGPKELPHMFERFYRGAAGRAAQGLGLGLYITRMLVEAHGGRIWVESEGPGQGSTFSFSLPTGAG